MRSELIGALLALGVGLLAALALAFLRPYEGVSIVIDTARIHIGVTLALLGIALVLCRAWRRGGVLVLFGAAIVLPSTFTTLSSGMSETAGSAGVLKVVDFNILSRNSANGGRIADLITASGADVVFIQEAEPIRPHLAAIGAVYPYRVGCGEVIAHCDSLLLAKLPLSDVEVHTLGPVFPQRTIVASLALPAGPLWLVGTHMTKPYFDFIGLSEMWQLQTIVEGLSGPVLVAGDFNAGLHFGAMADIVSQAGLVAAPTEPSTWPVRAGAFGIPIDHVLARLPARVLQTTAIADPMGSNHRGLESRVQIVAP